MMNNKAETKKLESYQFRFLKDTQVSAMGVSFSKTEIPVLQREIDGK